MRCRIVIVNGTRESAILRGWDSGTNRLNTLRTGKSVDEKN